MIKRLGLLMLTTTTLLIPSCGRLLLRKVAAQLVATYVQYPVDGDDKTKTIEMVDKVNMNWDYGGTDESEIEIAKEMVHNLTGENDPAKTGSITLATEKYDAFFEIGEEYGREKKKDYINDIIKWNLFTLDSSDEDNPIAVFDTYFPESGNYKYEAKVNDLYVSGPIFAREEQEEINVGSGKYHYDSKGRLLSGNINLNMDKIHISFNVNASYIDKKN